MRLTLPAILVVTLIGLGLATGPAYADCAADIETVEERLASLTGREKQKSGAVQAVKNLLDKAKDALTAGKAKKCEKLVQKANEKFDEKLE